MGELQPYLKELLELTVRQGQALVEDDMHEFQYLGDRREIIITKMKEMNLELDEEEKKILQQINLLDEEHHQELSKQFEQIKAELKNLNDYSKRDKMYIDQYSNMGVGRHFDTHNGR